jgi:hypothetical protein
LEDFVLDFFSPNEISNSLACCEICDMALPHCLRIQGWCQGKKVCEKKEGEYLCLWIIIEEAGKRAPQIFPK